MTKNRRKSIRTGSGKSREFCVIHPDGHVSDAELHEPILAGDHPTSDEIGKDAARRAGLSEDEIKKLYR